MPSRSKPTSTQHEFVECDLEFPRVIGELRELTVDELDQIEVSIRKINQMTWDQIYKTSSKTHKRGVNWEPISGQTTRSGKTVASIGSRKSFEPESVGMEDLCASFPFTLITTAPTTSPVERIFKNMYCSPYYNSFGN